LLVEVPGGLPVVQLMNCSRFGNPQPNRLDLRALAGLAVMLSRFDIASIALGICQQPCGVLDNLIEGSTFDRLMADGEFLAGAGRTADLIS
jgi:hypothetical protein